MATEQTREAGEFTDPGLGQFVEAERKERMGRNPGAGEPISIDAKRGEVPHRKRPLRTRSRR